MSALGPASLEGGGRASAQSCVPVPEDADDPDAQVLVAAALLQRHAELGDGSAGAELAARLGAAGQDAQSGRQLHTGVGHSLTTGTAQSSSQ